MYTHEMTTGPHEERLALLSTCEGKVVLSGYPSELYEARPRG